MGFYSAVLGLLARVDAQIRSLASALNVMSDAEKARIAHARRAATERVVLESDEVCRPFPLFRWQPPLPTLPRPRPTMDDSPFFSPCCEPGCLMTLVGLMLLPTWMPFVALFIGYGNGAYAL